MVGGNVLGYLDFFEEVCGKCIKQVMFQEGMGGIEIIVICSDDIKVCSIVFFWDCGLYGDLINNNVKFDVKQ